MSDIFENILTLLAQAGITPTVHQHAAVRTIEEAQQLAPHLVANLAKTIAFEIEPGPRVMGCNRRALRLLPAARVEAELGFEVGGLGPFALRPDIEVVMDSALLAQSFLRCGAGVRTRTLELDAADAVRASRARVASIARRAADTVPEI